MHQCVSCSTPSDIALMHQASQDASLTRTASIVIVGDEILSGKVADANSGLLCRELHALGWRVLRVRSLMRMRPVMFSKPEHCPVSIQWAP